MRNRYKRCSDWETIATRGDFALQIADVVDERTSRVHTDAARRVVRRSTGKAAVRGKGGTVPFIGESAWSLGANLFNDLCTKEEHAR